MIRETGVDGVTAARGAIGNPWIFSEARALAANNYLAGVNERLVRIAGEVADGFCAHPLNSPRYLTEVVRPSIEEGAKQAGRLHLGPGEKGAVSLVAPVFTIIGEPGPDLVLSENAQPLAPKGSV